MSVDTTKVNSLTLPRLGSKQRQLARVRSNDSSFRIASQRGIGTSLRTCDLRRGRGATGKRVTAGREKKSETTDFLSPTMRLLPLVGGLLSRYLFSAGVNRLVIDRSRVLLANDPVRK